MSGAQRLGLPPVYALVQGAPLGNTTPAARKALRLVEVVSGMLLPVCATMYVPVGVLTIDGSWVPVAPETGAGLGYELGGVVGVATTLGFAALSAATPAAATRDGCSAACASSATADVARTTPTTGMTSIARRGIRYS